MQIAWRVDWVISSVLGKKRKLTRATATASYSKYIYSNEKIKETLKTEFVEGGQYSTSWKKVTVPVSAIPATIDLKKVKQLYFNLEGTGEVFIDNIKLVGN